MKRLLTVAEVSAQLGITEKSLRQRIARGEFPAHRWGRKVVILSGELDAFLSQLAGTTSEAALRRVGER